jgi:hypothetical protein
MLENDLEGKGFDELKLYVTYTTEPQWDGQTPAEYKDGTVKMHNGMEVYIDTKPMPIGEGKHTVLTLDSKEESDSEIIKKQLEAQKPL